MRRTDREVTAEKDIINILDKCKTAALAMAYKDTPYVVPMSYGYELSGDELILYFHCANEGKKIDILRQNNNVCFTVFCEGNPVHSENPCNNSYDYSSVIGNGKAEFIENVSEKCYALEKLFEHQTGQKAKFTDSQVSAVCVFKVTSNNYTGKKYKT